MSCIFQLLMISLSGYYFSNCTTTKKVTSYDSRVLVYFYKNSAIEVVHNNCPRGDLFSAIVALKSTVSQRFSAVWRGLNRRTDP